MAEYLCEEDMKIGEYISRDEALRALHQYCTDCAISCDGVMCRACDHANAMDIISDMPAADVQPIRRGRWIAQLNGHVICSYCGKEQAFSSDFCKHCGADMRGDENG